MLAVGTLIAMASAQPAEPVHARPHPPSNARLLGALPTGASSYLVADLTRLFAEGSAFIAMDPSGPEAQANGDAFHPLTEAMVRYAGQAGPDAYAIAGSEFTPPTNLGVGDFNARVIIHAVTPITPPGEWLDAAGQPLELDSQTVRDVEVLGSAPAPVDAAGYNYAGPPWGGERRFVALADQHTVVLAESAEDVADMVLAWRGERAFSPHRFAPAFEPGLLDSPMVILRDGLPASMRVGADLASDGVVMVVLADVADAAFTIRYAGQNADEVLDQLVGPGEPVRSTDADGVTTADWSLPRDNQEEFRSLVLLVPAVIFGIPIFI